MKNKTLLEEQIKQVKSDIANCRVAWFMIVSQKNNAKTNEEKERAEKELQELKEIEKGYMRKNNELVKEYRLLKKEEKREK